LVIVGWFTIPSPPLNSLDLFHQAFEAQKSAEAAADGGLEEIDF
jgi:hypothetical protein